MTSNSNHNGGNAKNKTKCNNLNSALEYLLHVVEKHRLIFLYVAEAIRKNPLAIASRTGIYQTVIKNEISGWKQLEEDIGNDEQFLFKHRFALEWFAQEAISEFGPGPGCKPAMRNTNNEWVEVDGGTFPYWSINEITCQFLEDTSDEILEACAKVSSKDPSGNYRSLIEKVISTSHDNEQPRWYSSVIIRWEYLSELDKTIALIKKAKIDLAAVDNFTKIRNSSHDEININDLQAAIISSATLRELYRIRYFYPDVIEVKEAQELHEKLVSHLESTMSNPGFDYIKEIYKKPEFAELKAEDEVNSYFKLLLMQHPDVRIAGESKDSIEQYVEKAMHKCQEEAPGPVNEIIKRLYEIMFYDCMIANPVDDPIYQEPRRYIQLLESYWELCKKIVLNLIDALIGYRPNPLIPLIVNIRTRINICLDRLYEHVDVIEAKTSIDVLLDTVVSGQPDDISASPEWTTELLNKVELFIAETKVHLGSKTYPLNHVEEMFINQADYEIDHYHNKVKDDGTRMIQRAERIAKANLEKDNALQTAKRSSIDCFPTPQGSTWSDVNIKFKDGHTVSIKVKNKTGIYNYTQMGMANRKNGNPTVQWDLLRTFADEHGILTWISRNANRRNQKRREKLASNLESFFGIPEDPFQLTDNRKGWQARFYISPDE